MMRINRRSADRLRTKPWRVAVVETLESRLLLAADQANVFAHFSGDISQPGEVDTVRVHLTSSNFVIDGGHVTLGLVVTPDNGNALAPNPVAIDSLAPGNVPTIEKRTGLPEGSSLVLGKFKHGDFDLLVSAADGTTGGWHMHIFLAGDVTGDFAVDENDTALLNDVVNGTIVDPSFLDEGDANRDGILSGYDLARAQENKGKSTSVRVFTGITRPGREQDILVGETVILNAAVENTDVPVTLEWKLISQPSGSSLEFAAPAAPSQTIRPDAAGEYVISLSTSDNFGQNSLAVTAINVTEEPPPPPSIISVADIDFTAEHSGLIDPSSAIELSFAGPVDAASLTTKNVLLRRDDTPLAVGLAYDEVTSTLTVTPMAPLTLDSFFTVEVTDIGATVDRFEFDTFSSSFLTPEEQFSLVGGTVLTPSRSPLEGVIVRIADLETTSGPGGEFLFENVPTGEQVLDVDPSGLDDSVVYTPLHFIIDVRAGSEVNTVGQPIVLTEVDTSAVINYPAELILTNPNIPGLAIDFDGAVVTHPDGSSFTGEISLSPVVPTDVPMPFPGASETFWTIQPAGLLISPRAKITVPLPVEMDPGEDVELWAFNHGTNAWENYGMGQVNSDGVSATSTDGAGLPYTGWGAAITRREVRRTIRGTVVDAGSNPLHGVKIDTNGAPVIYTDYDSSSFDGSIDGDFEIADVLVGYNRFRNGIFEAFEAASGVSIVSTARDISGNTFTERAFVNVSGMANTRIKDGGLPSTITQPPITLDDYNVVDTAGEIHLHKDLAQGSNSHIVKPRSGAVPNSLRYREEVKAITRKLRSMGFRQNDSGTFLTEVSTYTAGSRAERAVKLFQTVWFHGGRSANFATVDGDVGPNALRALNQVNGVIWTTNLPFKNGFTYAGTTQKWVHGTIPIKLDKISTESNITDASRAIGGQRLNRKGQAYGSTHRAGGEVDIRWIKDDGNPGRGYFYRPLNGLKYKDVAKSKAGVPSVAEEYVPDNTPTAAEEAAARAAGKTWTLRGGYDRQKTQTLIDEILALNPTQVIFNDPRITDVSRVVGHSNHIHFGFSFSQSDIHPAGTDGAPTFAFAEGESTSFEVTLVEPGATSVVVDPSNPLVIIFNEAIDPSSLTGENFRLVSLSLGEIPISIQLDVTGSRVELVPNTELAENDEFLLMLSEDIRDTKGRTLDLGGESEVTTFATGLSTKVTSAGFVQTKFVLTRSNLSATDFRIFSQGADEESTREVTGSVEQFLAIHESGSSLELEVNDNGELTRIAPAVNGRSTAFAFLNNGVVVAALLEMDIVPEISLPSIVASNEPIRIRFDEPINTRELKLLSVDLVRRTGESIHGQVTLSNDGLTAEFTPDTPLPTNTPLGFKISILVTDPNDNSVEIVPSSSLFTAVSDLFTVDSLEDRPDEHPGDGVCRDQLGSCTLRAAIMETNTLGGSEVSAIVVPAGTYSLTIDGAGEDAAQRGDLDITTDLKLIGSDPRTTIINAAGLDRALDVLAGTTVDISRITITGGLDMEGAGVRNRGDLTINESSIVGNQNRGGGAGILNFGTLIINNSTISDNAARFGSADGGGLFNAGGTVSIANSTISGNSAADSGGGWRNNGGVATFVNTTLANNSANSGAAIFNSGGIVNVMNSIVTDSASGITSLGNNLIGGNPMIGPLQDNGGLTLTHALLPGSPAIDAGNNTGVTTISDQRGRPRIFDGDDDGIATVDIGAFELVFEILSLDPPNNSLRTEGLETLEVQFSKPLDRASITTDNIAVFEAGPNGQFGDPDDVPIEILEFQFGSNDATLTIVVAPLQLGIYQLQIQQAEVTDLSQNTLGSSVLTSGFSVVDVSALNRAYVTNHDDDTVSVVSLDTLDVVATIAVGDGPRRVSLTSDGSRAYVVNLNSDNVSVIDTARGEVIETITVGVGPRELVVSRDGNRVYVTNSASASVSVIDTVTNAVVDTLATRPIPTSIVLHPVRDEIWVGYGTPGVVLEVWSASDFAVLADVTSSFLIYAESGIAFFRDGSEAFGVENCGACGRFHRISGNPIGGTISIIQQNILQDGRGAATAAAINPLSGVAYLAKQGQIGPHRVVEFGGAGRTLAFAELPIQLEVSLDGSHLYVVHQAGFISVVDTQTLSTIGTVDVGRNPIGIALLPANPIAAAAGQANDSGGPTSTEGNADVGGLVAMPDFATLTETFGQSGFGLVADLDGDNLVNFSDFLFLASRFGRYNQLLESATESKHPQAESLESFAWDASATDEVFEEFEYELELEEFL